MEGGDEAHAESPQAPVPADVSEWRQGDYTHDLRDVPSIGLDDRAELCAQFVEVIGAVVVTQTCDIVNSGQGRDSVIMCPLVEVPEAFRRDASAGRTPSFAALQHPPENNPNVVIELNRMFTVEKTALARLTRCPGFSDDRERARFAFQLERKHGRFAYPDDFVAAMRAWRSRINRTHGKANSDAGRVYRSIQQMRIVALPHWEADAVTLSLFVILNDGVVDPDEIEAIKNEISEQLQGAELPDRFRWSEPAFQLGSLDDLPARVLYSGQVLDFQFLST